MTDKQHNMTQEVVVTQADGTLQVTQADLMLAEQVVSAANIVSHDGYYELDTDAVALTVARHRQQSSQDRTGKVPLAFIEAVLHGDDEHRAWLLEAASRWNSGQPVPPPRQSSQDRNAVLEEAMERVRTGFSLYDAADGQVEGGLDTLRDAIIKQIATLKSDTALAERTEQC